MSGLPLWEIEIKDMVVPNVHVERIIKDTKASYPVDSRYEAFCVCSSFQFVVQLKSIMETIDECLVFIGRTKVAA